MRERLPSPERERMLEAVVFGMALADKGFRESLDAIDFTYPLAAIVEEIQKSKPETWKLDGWLLDALSVERTNGMKVMEACRAGLKRNAAFRELQKRHGYEAIGLRMKELTEERKRTAERARTYRKWLEERIAMKGQK